MPHIIVESVVGLGVHLVYESNAARQPLKEFVQDVRVVDSRAVGFGTLLT